MRPSTVKVLSAAFGDDDDDAQVAVPKSTTMSLVAQLAVRVRGELGGLADVSVEYFPAGGNTTLQPLWSATTTLSFANSSSREAEIALFRLRPRTRYTARVWVRERATADATADDDAADDDAAGLDGDAFRFALARFAEAAS